MNAREARLWPAVGAALVVGAVAAATALPAVLVQWRGTPDAIGYVAAANAVANGGGLVDPIVYTNYLPELRPPAPAWVIRPPVFPLLLTLPILAGASWMGLAVVHVLWASAIGAAAVLVARRTMSLPSAIAVAIGIAWSRTWTMSSSVLLSEATAVGVLLLALATCRDPLSSPSRAVRFAALTILAWLSRPNLAVIALAVPVAAAFELGLHAFLRRTSLWLFLGSAAVLYAVANLVSRLAVGLPPYAHYGVMAEIIGVEDLASFQRTYAGPVRFFLTHAGALSAAIGDNLLRCAEALFVQSRFLFVGWIAFPGVLLALGARGEHRYDRAFAACAGVLLLATAVGAYGGYSWRYPLPGAVCLWFAGIGGLDDALRAVPPRERSFARALPLALVLLVWAVTALPRGGFAREQWESYRRIGMQRTVRADDTGVRELCAPFDRDAIVASQNPWMLHYWCGNAGLLLPQDLDTKDLAERWLAEKKPAYVITDGVPAYRHLEESARLELVLRVGGNAIYRAVDVGAEGRPWRAPPAPARLGGNQSS